ncbi:MAG: tetratricopeptide repeat protein [Thermoanaerobaculia bacterium]
MLVLLAGSALFAGGCAERHLGVRMESDLQAAIRARGVDPATVIIPFAPTDEMRTWLDAEVPRTSGQETQLNWLLQALMNRAQAPLKYAPGYTGTASEVFASGSANCLGFSQLFLALARQLNLPVYLLRVSDLQSFERDGDLIVASAHVTAAFGTPDQRRILDFAERPVRAYRWVEPISDLTAVALYYSNRGAEELREGRTPSGLALLETSVKLDPELAEAWVNLGVAKRRSGDIAGAEKAYRTALEADSSIVTGYQNLAALLRLSGREQEAEDLLGLVDRSGNRNPFSYLALGDLSLRLGRLEEAGRFYRRAVQLDPRQVECQAALGTWALAAGKTREAEKHLRKAREIDPTNRRVDELARRLQG